MNSNKAASDAYYLGIDGGGSKCKARLISRDARVTGTGVAGPANPFQNLAQARDSMVEAARLAVEDAGLAPEALSSLIVGAGLAGINIPRFHRLMSDWRHPFAELYLTTDIHIACLGAHNGEDGAVIVAGTGSVGYSCVAGVSNSFGAHGFPFGDKGSGAWTGLEAMKAALLALDNLGPATSLVAALEEQLGVSGLDMIDAMADASQRDYGALAPLVFAMAEAGDAVSSAILVEGAAYLDKLAGRLLDSGAEEFCMLGGLAEKIIPWMDPGISAHIVVPSGQPDEGAVRFAIDSHAGYTR